LTALAQQGKSISEKALEQFVDSGKYQYAFSTENFIIKFLLQGSQRPPVP